ncbi:MAG: hypothetical protein MRY74_11100 [Neomegalonema sp.]|nr:hypothetical protein [Neomegalonema sp.]
MRKSVAINSRSWRFVGHRAITNYKSLKQKGYLAAFPVVWGKKQPDVYVIDKILGSSRFVYAPLACVMGIITAASFLEGIGATETLLGRWLLLGVWLASAVLTGLLATQLVKTIISAYFQLQSTMFKFTYALRTFVDNTPDQPKRLQADIDEAESKIASERQHLPPEGEMMSAAKNPPRALEAQERLETLQAELAESRQKLESYTLYQQVKEQMAGVEDVTKSIIGRRLQSLALLGLISIFGLYSVSHVWSIYAGDLYTDKAPNFFERIGHFLNFSFRGSLFGLLDLFGVEPTKLEVAASSTWFKSYMWGCRFFTSFFISAVILEGAKILLLPKRGRTFGAAEEEVDQEGAPS